jgi:hypothetical protein
VTGTPREIVTSLAVLGQVRMPDRIDAAVFAVQPAGGDLLRDRRAVVSEPGQFCS